jgi:hypothetical protein
MKRSLPVSLDQVGGLRVARWIRESTNGQFDNFGPDAQRSQQDRAIERFRLVDTGLIWSVASSGWKTAWQTPAWEAMLTSARSGAFDVLVVGYVSRFLRNVKQTLIAIEDHLQPAGVVVLFADERLCPATPTTGASSSVRRRRPRHTAASSPSRSATATRRSAAGSGSPVATARRSG